MKLEVLAADITVVHGTRERDVGIVACAALGSRHQSLSFYVILAPPTLRNA